MLTPLGLDDIGRLVTDALHCQPEHARPLAQLVHEKTSGNPFFAIQFLTALNEGGLLVFDPVVPAWRWDSDRIRARSYTDNVADLLMEKMKRLSISAREAIKRLACLGNVADVATLTLVYEETEGAVHAALWEAVYAGLVLRQESAYTFLHDRIHQAAYSLIPEESGADLHLRIGRALLASMAPDQLAEHLFDVASQLSRGAVRLIDQNEKAQVARLNLRAGRRAKASAAYASACMYLAAGMALLDEEDWGSQYELMLSLWLERAECEFLIGDFDRAAQLIGELLQRATLKVHRAAVYALNVSLCTARTETARAVDSALSGLRLLDIDLPAHPTREQVQAEYELVWRTLDGRPIESLIDLPPMANPELQAAMHLLSVVAPPARYTDLHLYCLIACRMAKLGMQHGISDASPIGYSLLGIVLGPVFRRYLDAHRFANLACDLVDKHGFVAYRAKVYQAMGVVAVWTQPIAPSINFLRTAFRTATETGDQTYACFSMNQCITDFLLRNDPLDEVWRESEKSLDFVRKARFHDVAAVIVGQQRFIATMQGRTATFSTFSDGQFDGLAFEAQLAGSCTPTTVCFYWILKLKARFLSGDYDEALASADKAKALLWASAIDIQRLDYFYYAALTVAACYENGSASQQQEWREVLMAHQEQLREWAETYPPTFADKHTLVSAEIARLVGRDADAMRLYEQAIQSARENGFVQNEGLAHELAARFYATRGVEKIAHVYLLDARRCYLQWGALGKVRQLDELYPHLQEERVPISRAGTVGAPVAELDIETAVKASQAVSGEIVFENLIKTLMVIAVEHAGAERGLLILPRGDQFWVEAEAATGLKTVEVNLRQTLVSPSELPLSILQYVIRTQEPVISDNAAREKPFSADEYVASRHVRSVLCLPLIKQAKLVGVLYIENNAAVSVFTPARISVLKLLASQAAISLENSRLYRDLEDREGKIRRLVDSNIVGVFVGDFDGRILEANDAFLRIVGYDREDLAGGRINWRDLTPRDWRERDAQWIEEHKRTGVRLPIEKEYFRKDGSRVPVLVGSATFEVGGNQSVAFVLDVTERKRAEAALQESQAKFRDYAETASDWYWETDPNHKFTRVTDYERLLARGFAPVSRIGLARWEYATDIELEPEKWELHRSMLEARQPFCDFVYRAARTDGSLIYYKASGKPIYDAKGAFLGYRGTGVDVTAAIRAQEEHERLRQLESDLAHMNRLSMMGELAASLAHEITQPIAAARNNARAALNFLDRQPSDLGEVREALGCVVGDADRARVIIDRIRDHIRKAPPRKHRFDLNEAINEVIVLARSAIAENGVSVQTHLSEGCLPSREIVFNYNKSF